MSLKALPPVLTIPDDLAPAGPIAPAVSPKFAPVSPHSPVAETARKVSQCKKAWNVFKTAVVTLGLTILYTAGIVLGLLIACGVLAHTWPILLVCALAFCLTTGLSIAAKVYDYRKGSGDLARNILVEKIMKDCITELKSTAYVEMEPSGFDDWAFTRRVNKIHRMIKTASLHDRDAMRKFYKELRQKLSEVVAMPEFHNLDKLDPRNAYLQSLVEKIMAPESLEAMEAYGLTLLDAYKRTSDGKDKTSWEAACGALKYAVTKQNGFRREGLHKLIWAIAHPMAAMGKLSQTPDLNVYSENNMAMKGFTFTFTQNNQTRSVPVLLDGTPTSDNIYTAYLHTRDETQKHLDVTLQKRKGSEGERRRVMQAIADKHPDKLMQMGVDVNEAPWKCEGEFAASEGNAYLVALQNYLLEGALNTDLTKHPIYLKGLRANEIKAAIQAVQKLAPEGVLTKQQKQALLISVYGMLILKQMLGPNIASATIRCKQCFDRGPMQNGVLAIYQMALSGMEITDESIAKLIALSSTRPLIGEDRHMMKKHSDALLAFFRMFIDNRENFTEAVRTFVDPNNQIQFGIN